MAKSFIQKEFSMKRYEYFKFKGVSIIFLIFYLSKFFWFFLNFYNDFSILKDFFRNKKILVYLNVPTWHVDRASQTRGIRHGVSWCLVSTHMTSLRRVLELDCFYLFHHSLMGCLFLKRKFILHKAYVGLNIPKLQVHVVFIDGVMRHVACCDAVDHETTRYNNLWFSRFSLSWDKLGDGI